MKIKTVLLPEKIGTSGFNAKDHPELATVIECLRAQIPDGYGGLDESTLYGEIAIQTAIAYQEHMTRWRSVKDELPEVGDLIISAAHGDQDTILFEVITWNDGFKGYTSRWKPISLTEL